VPNVHTTSENPLPVREYKHTLLIFCVGAAENFGFTEFSEIRAHRRPAFCTERYIFGRERLPPPRIGYMEPIVRTESIRGRSYAWSGLVSVSHARG
jgi:hypothetical protein